MPARTLAVALTLTLCAAYLSSCFEEFDPPTLLTEVRVLTIRSERTDLTEGEITELTPLIANPFEDPIEYQWEWCAVNSGPNQAFECLTDELELDEDLEGIFDLGTQPTAIFPYPGNAEVLQEICEAVLAEVDQLPGLAELPACDAGVEVIVRLTVTSQTLEKVAIKRLFLWFERDPPEEQRNANPRIDAVYSAGTEISESRVLLVAPGSTVPFQLVLPEDIKEEFRPRTEPDAELSREEILISWFSTVGEWNRDRSFSDDENFSLEQAGFNQLLIPRTAVDNLGVTVYFVIRDGRGGTDWMQRQLRVVAPSGL